MKNLFETFKEIKKEYEAIVKPSASEVIYISFLVCLVSIFVSLSIIGTDFVIGSVINNLLFL